MCLLLGKRRCAQQKTPCAFCSGVVSAWCRLLRKSDVWPVDLLKKEPLKGNSEVHQHAPTKFGEDPSKDLGGVGEQTNKQTNKHCSNYSMIFKLQLMSYKEVCRCCSSLYCLCEIHDVHPPLVFYSLSRPYALQKDIAVQCCVGVLYSDAVGFSQ